jgi:hypothetical protein
MKKPLILVLGLIVGGIGFAAIYQRGHDVDAQLQAQIRNGASHVEAARQPLSDNNFIATDAKQSGVECAQSDIEVWKRNGVAYYDFGKEVLAGEADDGAKIFLGGLLKTFALSTEGENIYNKEFKAAYIAYFQKQAEQAAKQEESWASSFEGQLAALARRLMPPSTPSEGPVYAHPQRIQYGTTLTARDNLEGIPYGTALHPVRFTYSNSATLDAYWYKDEFDELKLLVKR